MVTLTKQINGTEVSLSAAEKTVIEAEWAANDAKTIEQAAAQALIDAKQEKVDAVTALKVTTAAGKEFNANEFSQAKLTTAISVLDDLEETDWKLADDSWILVSKEELKEALRLAGEAQTTIWKGV